MAGVPILGLNPSKKIPEFDGYAVFMNEQLEGTMDEDCLPSRRIWVGLDSGLKYGVHCGICIGTHSSPESEIMFLHLHFTYV
jgi:hypothetical protein